MQSISRDSSTTIANELSTQVESETNQCILGLCKYISIKIYMEPGTALYIQVQNSFQYLSLLNSTPQWRKVLMLAVVKKAYLVLSISHKDDIELNRT